VGVLILVAAAAVFWYSSIDRKARIYFAERALRERNADLALDWLKSIPESLNDGQREFLMARAYRRLDSRRLSENIFNCHLNSATRSRGWNESSG